jgi:hypothetical protein
MQTKSRATTRYELRAEAANKGAREALKLRMSMNCSDHNGLTDPENLSCIGVTNSEKCLCACHDHRYV